MVNAYDFYLRMGEALERCGFTYERANEISVKIIRDNYTDDVFTEDDPTPSAEVIDIWTRFEGQREELMDNPVVLLGGTCIK